MTHLPNPEEIKFYAKAYNYSLRSQVTQRLTKIHNCPVQKYNSITEISKNLLHVSYKSDTYMSFAQAIGLGKNLSSIFSGKDKIDFLTHPSIVQRGINLGSEENKIQIGDCEDYSAYCASAIDKNKLGKNIEFILMYWKSDNIPKGHAICTYENINLGTFEWISNWNQAKAIVGKGIEDIEKVVGTKVYEAISWKVSRTIDDSIILLNPRKVR